MKLSVCLDAVTSAVPPVQAVETLAGMGVPAVEFWSWQNKDLPALYAACQKHAMVIAGMCTCEFNLVVPAARAAYLQGIRDSAAAAKSVGCRMLISQVGQDTGEAREVQHNSIVEGLRACVPILQAEGLTLVIEPLNLAVNHPGYYLSSAEEAFAIVDEVGSPYVKVLYDIYHQQITEGNLLAAILPNLDKIAHFHAAGVPGRHELHTGEVNYPLIYHALEKAGYNRYFGLEYTPLGDISAGLQKDLAWLAQC